MNKNTIDFCVRMRNARLINIWGDFVLVTCNPKLKSVHSSCLKFFHVVVTASMLFGLSSTAQKKLDKAGLMLCNEALKHRLLQIMEGGAKQCKK